MNERTKERTNTLPSPRGKEKEKEKEKKVTSIEISRVVRCFFLISFFSPSSVRGQRVRVSASLCVHGAPLPFSFTINTLPL